MTFFQVLEYGFLMSKHVFIALGIKISNRILKKVADAKGGVLFFGISGMMAFCKQADEVLDSEYLDRKGTRK